VGGSDTPTDLKSSSDASGDINMVPKPGVLSRDQALDPASHSLHLRNTTTHSLKAHPIRIESINIDLPRSRSLIEDANGSGVTETCSDNE